MTQFHHQEYISKKLTELTAKKDELQKEYDAIKTNLNAVGGSIDTLSNQENSLKKQKTEFEYFDLIEKLKTVKVWKPKAHLLNRLPYMQNYLVKTGCINYINGFVGVTAMDYEGHIRYSPIDLSIPLAYLKTNFEPYTENEKMR